VLLPTPFACSALSTSTRSFLGVRLPSSRRRAYLGGTRRSTLARTLRSSVRIILKRGENRRRFRRTSVLMPWLAALLHLGAFVLVVGYAHTYYFHLRKLPSERRQTQLTSAFRSPQEQCPLGGCNDIHRVGPGVRSDGLVHKPIEEPIIYWARPASFVIHVGPHCASSQGPTVAGL